MKKEKIRKIVATSFIELQSKGDSEQRKILLLKRSGKVHTFQHHWAGISGSLETSDSSVYDCAVREIQEETQLVVGKDLKFIRSGRPLFVHRSDTCYQVFPFLFKEINFIHHPHAGPHSKHYSKHCPIVDDHIVHDVGGSGDDGVGNGVDHISGSVDGDVGNGGKENGDGFNNEIKSSIPTFKEKIKIDWEHDEFDFFEARDILHFEAALSKRIGPCVPDLDLALDRVYIMDKEFEDQYLSPILNNKTDGASAIVKFTLKQVLNRAFYYCSIREKTRYSALFGNSTIQVCHLIEHLKNVVWHIDHLRPSMSCIGNCARLVLWNTLDQFHHHKTVCTSPSSSINSSIKSSTVKESHDKEKGFEKLSSSSSSEAISNNLIENAAYNNLQDIWNQNIEKVYNQHREFNQSISQHTLDILKKHQFMNILTISLSGTVSKILKNFLEFNSSCQETGCKLFVAESRPNLEGRQTCLNLLNYLSQNNSATKISNNGCKITICTDVSAVDLCANGKIDCIIVGADAIECSLRSLDDGLKLNDMSRQRQGYSYDQQTHYQEDYQIHAVNKVGTQMLAMCSSTFQIPMFIVCDSLKMRMVRKGGEVPENLEHGNANELLFPHGFHINNGTSQTYVDDKEKVTKLGQFMFQKEMGANFMSYNPIFERFNMGAHKHVKVISEEGVMDSNKILSVCMKWRKQFDDLFFTPYLSQ